MLRGQMRIVSVVGARPNFVKMAPVISELLRRGEGVHHRLIHTGQHYDRMLSQVVLEQLGVRVDHSLGVGSASHAVQTARTMERLEPLLRRDRPDVVIVSGDVNSTLAAALVAAKLEIPVAHVEAGLRSFDRTMPEEINRVVTDQLAELLFVHSEDAVDNVRAEGIDEARVHFVGNTMIDSLLAVEETVRNLAEAARLGMDSGEYLLVTLHRPALVDGPLLADAVDRLCQLSRDLPVVFPVHPRTRKMLGGVEFRSGVRLIEPVGYLEFLSLEAGAAGVLTDAGGVQEETTYLGVPCFTLRDTTERPITIAAGTNLLLGLDPQRISDIPALLATAPGSPHGMPPLWDGRASERLVDVLLGTRAGERLALA
jgi:UDP-N-acetylglucosamine 2-epimerase (non-hydrolysing)